jgi:hypothetical protein
MIDLSLNTHYLGAQFHHTPHNLVLYQITNPHSILALATMADSWPTFVLYQNGIIFYCSNNSLLVDATL